MRARPLINKSAAELGAAVERNKRNKAALEQLANELGRRTTPSARRVRETAETYLQGLRGVAVTDEQTPPPPMPDSAEMQQRRQWTLEAIGDLRAKLIDLSKRNPLISFKHSERGATYLRIVDERPDHLFAGLTDGQMTFDPLPDEDRVPPDEQTDDFLIALERLRLTDTNYLEAIEGLGDEETDASALQAAERQLRGKVRQELGLPKLQFGKSIDVQALARAHGFDPSFELQDSDDEQDAAHHRDDKIRVLLTEKQLERRLSTIHDRYRGHERETGLHTLFLAFGFVEWFEDDESDLAFHAPALLLPVHLERALKRGRYVFTISAGDEDLQVNVAMRELLKQRFGLEAPELRENETPESYFIRISGLLEETKRFTLKRFVTLAVLPFPRMVLWQDLDPEQWPEDAFSSHELLVRLLGADSSGGAPSFGEDYPIDEPTFGKTVPPLVTEADVSQHSALIDVAAGIPLALEGPPGTGKSQTITNMIAGALDKGKKVLFIAEKQAALGVVAERLRSHGFGPLLLELHSDRATKSGLIESLRERVDAKAPNDRRNLSDLQKFLETQRTQLRTYLSLLRQPLGNFGRTAHQLIWSYLKLRQGIDDAVIVAAERKGRIEEALTLDATDLQRRREILDQVGIKLHEHARDYGNVDGNAWTRASKIEVLDAASLLDAMREVAKRAQALRDAAQGIRVKTGFPLSDQAKEVASQAALMRDAPEPDGLSDEQLKSVLAEPDEAKRLLEERVRWCALAEAVANVGADILLVDEERIDELEVALKASAGHARAGDVRSAAKEERQRYQVLSALANEAQSLGDRFGLDGKSLSIGQLHTICAVLVQRDEVSEAVRSLCRSAIMSDAFPGLLDSQGRLASELRERRAAIDEQVSAEGFAASPDELERIADRLENSGFFQRLLSGDFKRDRRTAERMLPNISDRSEASIQLRVLRQLLIDERSFRERSPARTHFPDELWTGADSDWEALVQARKLAETSYDQLAEEQLDELVSRILDASPLDLRAPTAKATALAGFLGSLPSEDRKSVFAEMLEAVESRSTALERLVDALDAVAVSDGAALYSQGSSIAEAMRAFRAADATFRASRRPKCLAWASNPERETPQLKVALDYRSNLEPDLLHMLEASDAPAASIAGVHAASRELTPLHDQWIEAKSLLEGMVQTDLETLLNCGNHALLEIASAAERVGNDEGGLRLAADLHRYLDEAGKLECRFVVEAGTEGALSTDRLGDLYELIVLRAILSKYLNTDGEALKRLGGLTLDAIRNRFREIDSELQEVEAKRIIAQRLADRSIWGRDSGPRGTWTEGALIDNELSKKKRHIPIRDLTKRAGRALQAMKPVWMMSPSSVAQYVQPGTVTFDLIVIDEASQMRPEYAVSSILRGRQLVVVGDSRQLPPTDFFQTTLTGMGAGDDGDDEDALTVDTESILDLANSRIGTRRQLNWHYRSRHESLIQFSNRQFYDRRLVVFPSPETDNPLLGVKHCFVGGTYEASINQEEAEAVIRDAIGLMIAHPECSIGIATMNIKQTELIKAEFDRLAGEQEAVRNYIAAYEGGIDRFFVKNLENVQGDERDIILISTVYGPDKNGRVMQRFGPIASDVGHRRLNVLVTRARLSTRVYTSLHSGDIKIVDGSKPGTVATQAYLTYAEGGARFDLSDGNEPDSDFEIFVADRLRDAGFELVHQVGVEKFRIDLGVRHPEYPLGFIAGVECDGAAYHSGYTVRDRDKIRQKVLEDLGWNIYRIWSTDWFIDPDREAAKLIAKVMEWRDAAIARFRARYASGEFRDALPAPTKEEPKRKEPPIQADAAANDLGDSVVEVASTEGPREPPDGRRRELDGIDWYEVETARLYEVWPDGEFGGEVEVLSRATGAPQIYGGAVRIPKSEYRGTIDASGASFIENDIYAAVRKVARMAREARPVA